MNIVQMIKAYGGMVFGKTDYWHPNMNYNKEASIDKINCYYVDMKAKHIYPGKLDENAIPLLEMDGELQYLPVTIAQYALGNFDKFIETKEKKYFEVCLTCADWFVENLREISKGVFGYINDYDKLTYDLKKPWLSSLSQGQVMSLLARCYYISRNEKYIDAAEKLLKSFEVRSEDKGVFSLLNNEFFYEEYPSKEPSYVLNGFIFSLWGLLDLYIVYQNDKAKELFDKGINTLENNLHLYNVGSINWSTYDLYPFKVRNIASIFYHKLHIEQLKAMYTLSKKEIFKEYYFKWEKSKNNKFKYFLATAYKIKHKLSVRKLSNYVPSISKK